MPYSREWLRFPGQLAEALRGWAEGGFATVRFSLPSPQAAFALRQQFYAFFRALDRARKSESEAEELWQVSRRLSLGVHLPGTFEGVPKNGEGVCDLTFYTATNGRWAEALDELTQVMGRKNQARESEARLAQNLLGENDEGT